MDDKEAQRVREFQEAYKEGFNEEITTGEASVMLTQLVQLYELICRPVPQKPLGTNEEATET